MEKFVSLILFLITYTIVGSNALLSHSQAICRLRAEGILVSSSGSCSSRNNNKCTSLDQIRETTIQGIITLKKASSCEIVVTGGTEIGHGEATMHSHWNGYKVNVRQNICIDNYIVNNFEHVGLRSDKFPQYQQKSSGNSYAQGKKAWDIIFYK